jgi:MoxR-like ATPase
MGIPENVLEQLNGIRQRHRQRDATGQAEAMAPKAEYLPPHPAILLDAIVALVLGKNVLLKGPTGSGKTRFAEYLSAIFSQPMHSINCSVDLDAEALLGFKTLSRDDGGTRIEFVEGPVVKAMKQGALLYIDEINMARPETLPILNGVLDYRRRITNPFTGEVIHANDDFRVIAAINYGYVGTMPLNEALKNRFVVIDVPYVQGDQLERLLQQNSKLEDKDLRQLFVRLSADLVQQAAEGQLPDEAASIRALIDACDLATYIHPLRAIERAIADKLDDPRERQLVMHLAETWFGDATSVQSR